MQKFWLQTIASENVQVKKYIHLLKSSDTAPYRKTIGDIYTEENKNICSHGYMSIKDMTTEGQAFLYKTTDSSGQRHTSE